MTDPMPRRFRIKLVGKKHPNGSDAQYFYGCYFPQTDLCITEMARPGTGVPKDVEWLDEPSDLMRRMMA
jgi:hypothetical protein